MNIKMSEEVKKALKTHQKVVALESTIISHGLPYPDNIEVAKTLESIIREEGAIPATIAIINGEIKVGLDEHDLEILAKEDVVKVSKREILGMSFHKKNMVQLRFQVRYLLLRALVFKCLQLVGLVAYIDMEKTRWTSLEI